MQFKVKESIPSNRCNKLAENNSIDNKEYNSNTSHVEALKDAKLEINLLSLLHKKVITKLKNKKIIYNECHNSKIGLSYTASTKGS